MPCGGCRRSLRGHFDLDCVTHSVGSLEFFRTFTEMYKFRMVTYQKSIPKLLPACFFLQVAAHLTFVLSHMRQLCKQTDT